MIASEETLIKLDKLSKHYGAASIGDQPRLQLLGPV